MTRDRNTRCGDVSGLARSREFEESRSCSGVRLIDLNKIQQSWIERNRGE